MITNLSIEKLRPHPNNPRKDLGDLTELADSIKANGIFQNLTVVSNDDDTYTIIIGHRRTAAAKLAGLKELPCAIVEMSEKDQLGTMLLENMQRSDLTVYEEAQGLQMMIDLGESVKSISEKTGMGKSTIYNRVKLCQLDKDKFKKGQERGATLEDYAKLDKITDPELKNRALDNIGTPNFENAVRIAIADEKYNEKLAKWETLLSTFAIRMAAFDCSKYESVQRLYMCDSEYNKFEVPEDSDTVEYYYIVGNDSWNRDNITIFKERTKSSLQEAQEKEEYRLKEEDRELRGKKLKELAISFSKAKADFIRNYTSNNNTAGMNLMRIVNLYILCTNSDNYWSGFTGCDRFKKLKDVCEYIGFDFDMYEEKLEKGDNLIQMIHYVPELGEKIQLEPEKFMLACLCLKIEYHTLENDKYIKTWDYYNESRALSLKEDKYISLFESLGYQMSDEERSLYDGTHELYIAEEDEEFLDEDDIPDFEEDE